MTTPPPPYIRWSVGSHRELVKHIPDYSKPPHPALWPPEQRAARPDRLKQAYSRLAACPLSYKEPPRCEEPGVQLLRSSHLLLEDRGGNCVDLTLTLAGMCLLDDLFPVLVGVRGHLFLAVAEQEGLWRTAFKNGHTDDLVCVQRWAADRTLHFVESTGVARVGAAERGLLDQRFPEGDPDLRRRRGRMSFAQACKAGQDQLLFHSESALNGLGNNQRLFEFALDVQYLKQNGYGGGHEKEPTPPDPPKGSGPEKDVELLKQELEDINATLSIIIRKIGRLQLKLQSTSDELKKFDLEIEVEALLRQKEHFEHRKQEARRRIDSM